MENNWKIIVPVAIVGLVLVAIVMGIKSTTPVTSISQVPRELQDVPVATETPAPAVSPTVSGNVDDMMGVLTGEASGDAAVASGVAATAASVKNDTQEVNSLTTTYDETTF